VIFYNPHSPEINACFRKKKSAGQVFSTDSYKGVRIKYHTGLISASPLLMETLRHPDPGLQRSSASSFQDQGDKLSCHSEGFNPRNLPSIERVKRPLSN